MREQRILACLALAAVIPLVMSAVEPMPLPPFIVMGRVVDYDGAGLKTAEVRVRKAGTLVEFRNVDAPRRSFAPRETSPDAADVSAAEPSGHARGPWLPN